MDYTVKHLTPRKWTRPEKLRDETRLIVIHWVANPGITPLGIWKFFETRTESYGSANLVIGNTGKVFELLPLDEVAYHCGSASGYTPFARAILPKKAFSKLSSPNWHTIGIELCHLNSEGEHSPQCLKAAVRLTATLCKTYRLNPHEHVVTHQMVVGWKRCPKWMVDHPDDFELFRHAVDAAL